MSMCQVVLLTILSSSNARLCLNFLVSPYSTIYAQWLYFSALPPSYGATRAFNGGKNAIRYNGNAAWAYKIGSIQRKYRPGVGCRECEI